MFAVHLAEAGEWVLDQGSNPIAWIRRDGASTWLRSVSGAWCARCYRRGRFGWQLELVRTDRPEPAVQYLPSGRLRGGRIDAAGGNPTGCARPWPGSTGG